MVVGAVSSFAAGVETAIKKKNNNKTNKRDGFEVYFSIRLFFFFASDKTRTAAFLDDHYLRHPRAQWLRGNGASGRHTRLLSLIVYYKRDLNNVRMYGPG